MNRLFCCLAVVIVFSVGCARTRRVQALSASQVPEAGALVSLRPVPPALSTRAAVVSRSGDALRRNTEGALLTHGSKTLKVLARHDHEAIAAERQFQQDGTVSDESMASLAQTLGADSLVLVSQTRSDNAQQPLYASCATDLQVVHVETGEILGLAQEHSAAQRLQQRCVQFVPRCKRPERNPKCVRVDMDCLCHASLVHAVQAITSDDAG